jgi:hypothetical protein
MMMRFQSHHGPQPTIYFWQPVTRVRCLGYIINLAAKAFLFGKNADAFEDNINAAYKNNHLEALREE